jgi:hypothetical protein
MSAILTAAMVALSVSTLHPIAASRTLSYTSSEINSVFTAAKAIDYNDGSIDVSNTMLESQVLTCLSEEGDIDSATTSAIETKLFVSKTTDADSRYNILSVLNESSGSGVPKLSQFTAIANGVSPIVSFSDDGGSGGSGAPAKPDLTKYSPNVIINGTVDGKVFVGYSFNADACKAVYGAVDYLCDYWNYFGQYLDTVQPMIALIASTAVGLVALSAMSAFVSSFLDLLWVIYAYFAAAITGGFGVIGFVIALVFLVFAASAVAVFAAMIWCGMHGKGFHIGFEFNGWWPNFVNGYTD